jgi:hypothetical protein
LAAFAGVTRQALADAIADDRAYGNAVWEELDAALDAWLEAERQRLTDAMNDCREAFRLELKNIYGYDPQPGIDNRFHDHLKVVYYPYTHNQQQQFLYKFNHYHEDVLQ